MRISGARVLITGAAGGIGTSLALEFARRGAGSLILVDRDDAALSTVRGAIGELAAIETCVVDLTERAEVLAFAEKQGDVDLLVNNAGISVPGRFDATPLDAIERTLDINLVAAVRLTRLVLPKMGPGGCIVNVASASGLMAPGGLAAYAASKFGLVGFSDALRVELAERNINVVAVCPAFVRTAILERSAAQCGDNEKARARSEAGAKRAAVMVSWGIEPDDLARRVVCAIERGERQVVTSLWAKALITLRRVSPRAAEWVMRAGWLRMVKKGLVE